MRISISCGPFTEKNTVEIEKQQSHRRRAQQSRARRQSAAVLPSLAPHGVGRGCNMNRHAEDSWRSHVHRTYTAQRVQPFKPKACNVGGRGERPSPFSGGSKGGILFGKRIPPLSRQQRRVLHLPRACAEQFANGFVKPFPESLWQHKHRSPMRATANA